MWRRFREAHVHCQPSTWEAFGLSTWEALACGCNIVATRQGFGSPWFGPYGSLCDPTEESVRVALQEELRRPRGWARFRPPTWQEASRSLIPIYREALGG